MQNHNQMIQLIMTYLKDQNLNKSLIALEQETQLTLDTYSKELQFFRQLVIDGSFGSAEQYLQPLKNRLSDLYPKIILELKKQQYFELIDTKPDIDMLVTLLKSIEQISSPDVYKNLCYFLTMPTIRDHPDYAEWTFEKGRLDCFDKITNHLKCLGRTFRIDKYNSIALSELVERYTIYQHAFNVAFEEEHDIIKQAKCRVDENVSKTSLLVKNNYSPVSINEESQVLTTKAREKLAFHTRAKSGEMDASSQFYNSSNSSRKQSKAEQDKNIIIEKLQISDINHDEQDSELQTSQLQQSQLFNYKFEDMMQVGYLTDTHPIRAATFSSDGEMFAVGTNSKSLRIYSMKSLLEDNQENNNQEIQLLFEKKNHHQGSIYCIDWSHSGKLIATGSNDKTVKLLNHEEESDYTLVGHKGLVRSVCFTDDNRLLSAGQDTVIKVWDVEQQKCIRNLEGHTQPVYCIQTAGDGSYQVSVGQDRTLRIWDQRAGKAMAVIGMASEINYVSLSEGANNHNLQNLVKGSRKAPQFTAQSLAALAHSDGTVSVWNLHQQKCMKVLKHHTLDCRCVEFDPTGKYLASVSFDSTIAIYDWEAQKLVSQITEHDDRVVLCKWHPFYPFILSTSADQTGRIFAPHGFLVQLIKSFNFIHN